MDDRQKLEANRRLLSKTKSELSLLKAGNAAVIEKYVPNFPGKTREEIRQMLILARDADIESFTHIIEVYEKQIAGSN